MNDQPIPPAGQPQQPIPQPQGAARSPYPVTFDVDYPDRELNRLTSFFRIFTIIPILIVAGAISGYSYSYVGGGDANTYFYAGGGILFAPTLLLLVFRRKYPRWWFDWNLELTRFMNRIYVYLSLMNDRYPSTDDHQAVRFDMVYPDAERDLNRWLPIVKWLLAIPHYIVLAFLYIAVFFVVVFVWFAILFTGRYPRGAFDFVKGVFRWSNRVNGYAILLVTDRYPPFSLDP